MFSCGNAHRLLTAVVTRPSAILGSSSLGISISSAPVLPGYRIPQQAEKLKGGQTTCCAATAAEAAGALAAFFLGFFAATFRGALTADFFAVVFFAATFFAAAGFSAFFAAL